jgi:hypothetical protein
MRKLVAAFSIFLLAGCATLPTEIDIKSGPELVAPEQNELSYYTPTGPVNGASSQEIVSGFLAAGTGPQNDYGVARQYLTAEFAQRWNPESGVLIRTGVPVFQASGDTLQTVEIGVGARVDEQGRYLDAEVGERTSLRFQLLKEGGEWRIASAPNLTVVTAPVFSVVFSAFPVYFLDSNQSKLVPDLRWFPTRASTGTKLVNALLSGPSDWLAESVTTAIPAGTKLTIDAVSIRDGIAEVDFDSTALNASAIERRLMLTQLRSTLLQLAGVVNVSVSIDNSPQEIIPTQIQSVISGGPVFIARDTGVFRVNAADSSPLRGTANFLANNKISKFAVTSGGNKIAFVTDKGVYQTNTSGLNMQTTKISEQKDVAELFYDDWGYLWLIPEDQEKPLTIISAQGESKNLNDGATARRISYRISGEGTRLGKIVATEEEAKVSVQGVIRDSRGWPIRMVGELEINTVLGQPLSLTWQQNAVLRVLERTTSGLTALSDYPVSGPRSQLTMPPVAGVEITEGPSGLSTYMLTEQGEVWVLTGTAWRRLTTSALGISTDG